MLRSFLFILFFSAYGLHEILKRRKAGLKPATFGELYRYVQKNTSPFPWIPPLAFAFLTLECFGLWEGFLRFMLNKEGGALSFSLAIFAGLWALYRRDRAFRQSPVASRPTLQDLGLLVIFPILLFPSILSLLLAPWVFWRAKAHLKRRDR